MTNKEYPGSNEPGCLFSLVIAKPVRLSGCGNPYLHGRSQIAPTDSNAHLPNSFVGADSIRPQAIADRSYKYSMYHSLVGANCACP